MLTVTTRRCAISLFVSPSRRELGDPALRARQLTGIRRLPGADTLQLGTARLGPPVGSELLERGRCPPERVAGRAPLPVPALRPAEREERPRRVEREAEPGVLSRDLLELARLVVVVRPRETDRCETAAGRHEAPGVVLGLRELGESRHDRRCPVELLELDEHLDELGRRREGARVVHALALGVTPRPAQRLGGGPGLAGEQTCRSQRARRLQQVPVRSGPPGTGDRLVRPGHGRRRVAPPHGEECAAPLVHRPQEQLGVRRLRPFVEQALGDVPAAGPQLELAHVEPLERVRGRLPALVRHVHQAGQRRPRLGDLAAPDEALSRNPLR